MGPESGESGAAATGPGAAAAGPGAALPDAWSGILPAAPVIGVPELVALKIAPDPESTARPAVLPAAPAANDAADAAALLAETGGAAGGETLPSAGKCPPIAPVPAVLCPVALRTGLAAAPVSAAAKSGAGPPLFDELTDAGVLAVGDTGCVAFIS